MHYNAITHCISDHVLCFYLWLRFWSGLYNQFDRRLHPRQSALECLVTVKEKNQQLEEDLAICEQVGIMDCMWIIKSLKAMNVSGCCTPIYLFLMCVVNL